MASQSTSFWPNLMNLVNISNLVQSDPNNDLHDLKVLLKSHFRGNAVQVFLFGSRFLGVGNERSDFDVCVKIDNGFIEQNIMGIKNAIKSDANWKFLEMLDGKCHVIRAVRVPMNLQYDINCSGDLAYCKNKLVKYIFDLQPIARYMVIYLRDWTNKHNLSGSFRSHIIVKMVIYFLQVAKFLPGIQHFLKNQLITSEDCDVDFIELKLSSFNMSKIIVNETETREILIKFFQYYSNFSFSYYTICPYLGLEVSTSSLSTKMPKSFTNPYFYRDAIVAQDMFYLNCNKAKPIKPCSVEHFKAACRKSVV